MSLSKPFLSVAEAAKILNVQRYLIREAIHKCELPAKEEKIPGGFHYQIPVDSLKKFAEAHNLEFNPLDGEKRKGFGSNHISDRFQNKKSASSRSLGSFSQGELESRFLARDVPAMAEALNELVEQVKQLNQNMEIVKEHLLSREKS
ncbi:hypothetical protein [Heliorestis convoluta]|uniref:hypothetical protein n=1 Tax=Heliorestis convoluta TaxID=356322 RepID=UPI00129A7090|nr:hypothetical protein [Heliorestis convoluta]